MMSRCEMNRVSKDIFKFLLLATVIPLVCVGIMHVAALSYNSDFIGLVLFGIQAMAPTLATVILILRKDSFYGLKAFLKDKYVANISFKLCLLAFIAPMLILLASKTIITFCIGSRFQLSIPNATGLLIILWTLIAEELGWRGYLQEKIELKFGMAFTPLIIGVIWGVWHFHYFLIGQMNVAFGLLVLGTIFESYGYFVITKLAKGNVLPASVWHFSGNLFINLFMLNEGLPYLVTTFAYSVCVVIFVCYYMTMAHNPNFSAHNG